MKKPRQSAASYTLTNRRGSRAIVSDYGCVIMSLEIAAGAGSPVDVVLGYDTVQEYRRDSYYLGIVAGRCAGRIARGRLEYRGESYTLPTGGVGHHLHGGKHGFGKRLWEVFRAYEDYIELVYRSPGGEEGYPGELVARVSYRLTDEDELRVVYRGESNCHTLFSPTQHSYFNLCGHAGGDIEGHELLLNSDTFVPVDPDLIPTGELLPVQGTAMDFREFRPIGQGIGIGGEQLQKSGGYDHSWQLRRNRDWTSEPAALVREPQSGRQLAVFTDRPALHFYSGNMLSEGIRGKQGAHYGPRQGLCLETQHLPTVAQNGSWEGMEVSPEALFESETRFAFSGFDQT